MFSRALSPPRPTALMLLLALIVLFFPLSAAGQGDAPAAFWYVFVERGVDSSGADRLIFVHALTGEEVQTLVYGERYTPIHNAVMLYDTLRQRVMLAAPDGTLREHPFIQPGVGTRRVDWLVADDATRIAWTLTNDDGQGRLTTITTVANIDGTNPRQALVDGPNANGLRALPLAFSQDLDTLYMDLHPDGLSNFMPIAQYAGLFALDLFTGDITPLPGEAEFGCLCGAGIGAGLLLRLGLTADQQGFNLRVYNLAAGSSQTLPALNLRNYTFAGDVLITDDGSQAVYALTQIANFGTPQQSTRTVFVLVDLVAMTQEALTQPITTLVRPVEWTDAGTAILFISPNRDGTWKINLADGQLVRVAEATYVGTIGR